MPAPRRPRQPSRPQRPAPAPPVIPLGIILREHDTWRRSLPGKPTRGALRDHWQKQDAKQGQRPDYALWRELNSSEAPPQKRQDTADLAQKALRASDPAIQWAALCLLPDLMESPVLVPAKKDTLLATLRQRLITDRHPLTSLTSAPQASALLLWIARSFLDNGSSQLWPDLLALLQKAQPDWKPGRKLDLSFWDTDPPWPLSKAQIARRLAMVIHRLVRQQTRLSKEAARELVPWHLTAWTLLRDARAPQSPSRPVEIEVLLDAATTTRLSGDADAYARLTALAMHLLPQPVPEALKHRCKVASWHLSETGFTRPDFAQVSLDDLPFPGDPPASDNGKAATEQYLDEADLHHHHLTSEVQNDPEWEVLRKAGVVLHHPLAALTWIARKAQAYALKKQTELLQAAASLATRHQRLTTLARLLPHLPASADTVNPYAQTLRQSQRRMPFLRDHEQWQEWTRGLRLAWAKLETASLQDAEHIFFLHETLLDREVTLSRCLPSELRILGLRHLHSRRQPSPLVQELAAEPRQMQQLEHQRQVELWSVATELRERAEISNQVWISLVMRGERAQGRYSLIVQGPAGRVIQQDRLRSSPEGIEWTPLFETLQRAIAEANPAAERLVIALDPALMDDSWTDRFQQAGLKKPLHFIPSWEWAFRVLRESPATSAPSEWLWPASTTPASIPGKPLPASTCVLLPTADLCDANTRWNRQVSPDAEASEESPLRSIYLGACGSLISGIPVHRGPLKNDLVRLCLAQNTRTFIAPPKALTEDERASFQDSAPNPPEGWLHFGL